MTRITPPDLAPNLPLKDQQGDRLSLARRHGRNLVVHYIPDDGTPEAAAGAKALEGARQHFEALNTELIGISPDSSRGHRRFAEKNGLQERLLSDRGRKLGRELGLVDDDTGEAHEATLVIDADGRVDQVYEGNLDEQRVRRIVEDLRRLQGKEAWDAKASFPAFF